MKIFKNLVVSVACVVGACAIGCVGELEASGHTSLENAHIHYIDNWPFAFLLSTEEVSICNAMDEYITYMNQSVEGYPYCGNLLVVDKGENAGSSFVIFQSGLCDNAAVKLSDLLTNKGIQRISILSGAKVLGMVKNLDEGGQDDVYNFINLLINESNNVINSLTNESNVIAPPTNENHSPQEIMEKINKVIDCFIAYADKVPQILRGDCTTVFKGLQGKNVGYSGYAGSPNEEGEKTKNLLQTLRTNEGDEIGKIKTKIKVLSKILIEIQDPCKKTNEKKLMRSSKN